MVTGKGIQCLICILTSHNGVVSSSDILLQLSAADCISFYNSDSFSSCTDDWEEIHEINLLQLHTNTTINQQVNANATSAGSDPVVLLDNKFLQSFFDRNTIFF